MLDFSPSRKAQEPQKGRVIPRIIHKFWTGPTMPEAIAEAAEDWRTVNPDWTHKLWRGARASGFLRKHFHPMICNLFDAATIPALQADLFRYAVLYVHGGLYVDADMAPRGSLSPTFPRHTPMLITVSFNAEAEKHIVKNDLIAAAPGNPLFLDLLRYACSEAVRVTRIGRPLNVHSISGPTALRTYILQAIGVDPMAVTLLPRADAKHYFRGVHIDYGEIGGHWSVVQYSRPIFSRSPVEIADDLGLFEVSPLSD